jgi:conjugative transfer signal peptidase TraF
MPRVQGSPPMTVNGRFKDNVLRWVLTPIWILLALIGVLGLSGMRINLTDSLPRGLYLITDDLNATLVEFCPQGIFSALSVQRGYRPGGICPDREAPLIKPVIARPGDTVVVSAEGISVNGRQLPNTKARLYDSTGRPLGAWPSGVYSVAPATVWVASTYHPNSFDSRYFGPISVSIIRHRLRPLWLVPSTRVVR